MNLERNYKLKRVLLLSLCVLVLFGLAGCREKRSVSFENDISEEIIDNSTESQISAGELEKTEITDKSAMDDEREYMKLYFMTLKSRLYGKIIRLCKNLWKKLAKVIS